MVIKPFSVLKKNSVKVKRYISYEPNDPKAIVQHNSKPVGGAIGNLTRLAVKAAR